MPGTLASCIATEAPLGQKPVLFVLPGIADNASLWAPLQEAFDCRIVRYLDWTEFLDGGLGAVVSDVARQIQIARQPGDLRLIGYSIGGQFGFAVAMALEAAGIPVSSLTLLDAGTEVSEIPRPFVRRTRERLQAILAALVSRDGMANLVAKCLMLESMEPYLRRLARARHSKLQFGFDLYLHNRVKIQLMRRMYWPWWRETIESRPSLAAPTFLFRAADHARGEAADLGWRRFCPNLQVVQIAAGHKKMMDSPSIERIREQLQSIFDQEGSARRIESVSEEADQSPTA
jgi:thioesterase domain-containing protein